MNTLRLKLGWMIVFATACSPAYLAAAQADQVVTISTRNMGSGADDLLSSLADFAAWKLGASTLKEVALYTTESYDVSADRFHGRVPGYAVWVSIFDVLGIRPVLGRAFLPEEKQQGHSDVVILSYDLWQTAFGRDPALIVRSHRGGRGKPPRIGTRAQTIGRPG